MKRYSPWILPGLLLGTAVALLMPLPSPWPQMLAFLLLFIWPVFSWIRLLPGAFWERLALAAGLVLALNAALTLLLVYAPGEMIRPYQLTAQLLIALLPLFKRQKSAPASIEKTTWLPILLLALFALSLRLPHLGYSEFQGDEGVIMTRAAAIIMGDDAELFLHQKGPVEILLPLGLWNLAGSISEFWARLPFAWAGLLAVMTTALLGWRWFDRKVGIAAGVLFAIVGFAVAFSRIVQYQSLVMAWGGLAVLAAIRYADEERRADLALTAVFLAMGLLAHYDAILVAPVIGWLLLRQVWCTKQLDWRAWGGGLGLGVGLLAAFYVPYALNPNIGRTGAYLIQGRLGAGEGRGLLSWSGTAVWQIVTFYNSVYFIAGLILLLALALWQLWRRRDGLAPVLFFAVPLLFYLFIVADPRTHVYTFFPGAVILAAAGGGALWQKVKGNGRYPLSATILATFLVSASYVVLLFVDNTPERQRNWGQSSLLGYLAPGADPPLYGLFGFPHRAGWSVVNDLLSPNAYPYASNEEREVTHVYMAPSSRTHCANFETFIVAQNAQDAIPYDAAWLDGLFLQADVLVNGRPSLQIYGRQPVTAVPRVEAANQTLWFTPAQVAPAPPPIAYPLDVVLGDDQIRLLGYDLDRDSAAPGEQIVVILYWEALRPLSRNYQAFVHLTDGNLLAQHDGAPECDINPTTRWEPGQIIADPHLIAVPADAANGAPELFAGMYDLLTGERLTISEMPDNLVRLTNIAITSD